MPLRNKITKWIEENNAIFMLLIEPLLGFLMFAIILGITFLIAYLFNLFGLNIENSVIIFALLFIIFTTLTVFAYLLFKKRTHKKWTHTHSPP